MIPQTYIKQLIKHPHKLGHLLGFKKLKPFHDDWIKYCWLRPKGNTDLRTFQAHRNSYKTTAIVITAIVWWLLFHPNISILLVRKTATNASSIIKAVGKQLRKPKVVALFEALGHTGFCLTRETAESLEISSRTTAGVEGSLDSTGIGGDITGRHYDIVICDDVVTIKDRTSKARREETKAYIQELINIVKSTGFITVLGTPWHQDDVFSILPEPLSFPIGTVAIDDLTPEKIEQIKASMTPAKFSINYELKHATDELQPFSAMKFKQWQEKYLCYAYLDPAYTGTNTTALVLVQRLDDHAVIKGYAWRDNVVNLYDQILDICYVNNVYNLAPEKNGDKGLAELALQERAIKKCPKMGVKGFTERQNKEDKILSYLLGQWEHIYFSDESNDEFLEQVAFYQIGQEPDDAVDICSSAIRELNINFTGFEQDFDDIGAVDVENNEKKSKRLDKVYEKSYTNDDDDVFVGVL